MHEELETMSHSDSEVAALYDKAEASIILQITKELKTRQGSPSDLPCRVYAVFHLVE